MSWDVYRFSETKKLHYLGLKKGANRNGVPNSLYQKPLERSASSTQSRSFSSLSPHRFHLGKQFLEGHLVEDRDV